MYYVSLYCAGLLVGLASPSPFLVKCALFLSRLAKGLEHASCAHTGFAFTAVWLSLIKDARLVRQTRLSRFMTMSNLGFDHRYSNIEYGFTKRPHHMVALTKLTNQQQPISVCTTSDVTFSEGTFALPESLCSRIQGSD